jgi:hypothetical protein
MRLFAKFLRLWFCAPSLVGIVAVAASGQSHVLTGNVVCVMSERDEDKAGHVVFSLGSEEGKATTTIAG